MRCVFDRLACVVLFALAAPGCKDDEGSTANAGDETSGPGSDEGETATGESTGSSSDGSDTALADSESGAPADPGPWDTFAERPCPEDSFVTYENFGWPHMLTFCTGCHSSMLPADMRQGAPIGIDFESIDDVRAQASRIWTRAADQHATMPPVGPAAEEERFLLGEWLACGAPTNADLEDQ